MTSASGTDDGPLQRPDSLVAQLPRASPLNEERHKSSLYSYFGDSERFVVVVGEKVQKADWALVYGLSERAGRRLHLLLPANKAFATQQRVPWLTDAARPEIWVHESGHVEPSPAVSRAETIQRVRDWAHERSSETTTPGPMAELAKASTPAHLGPDGHRVAALAEWATSHPQLDASHRQGERAWHCAGQKVLSFKRNAGLDITIRAGIHDTKRTSSPDLILRAGTALSPTQLAALQAGVLNGVQDRLLGRRRKPDEHWLQSVLRRHPSMVGIEAPALREVPAWRPTGAGRTFGRGFLDLLGLDGQGDIRIVEAKLAKSNDDGVLLQGLDYYIWASAYIDALRQRLSAPAQAELRLHYAVGIAPADQQVLPPRAYRYASAIDTGAVPFRFHLVRGWETLAPDEHAALQPQKWAESSLPYAGGKPPSA